MARFFDLCFASFDINGRALLASIHPFVDGFKV